MKNSLNGVKLMKMLIASLAAILIVFASGCSLFEVDKSGTEDVVTISLSEAEIEVGETITLTATSSAGRTISWISSDDSIAEVDGGVVTGISEGEVTITATDGKKLAYCEITVTPLEIVTVTLSRTEVQVNVGAITAITATASDNSPIIWRSTNESVATVSGTGELGTITGVGLGETYISATTQTGGAAVCKVTVIKSTGGSSVTVTISQTTAEMQVGDKLTLTASASDNSDLNWYSEDSKIATVTNGEVTAVGEGKVLITVTSVNGGGATCEVTVKPAPPSVNLNATATVEEGKTITLNATSSDGSAITWFSENTAIATVTTNGVVTGVSMGTVKITANSASGGYAECIVSVIQIIDGKSLVWSDEFNGTSLDMDKWSYQTGIQDDYYGNKGPEYWGNWELEYYTEGDNVSFEDGALVITAKKENRGNRNYTSTRIVTRDKYTCTFGYIEARMKTPAINGMWPAFWMLPQPSSHSSGNNEYGGWAANGEIDIMEAKGRLLNKIDTTIHFGGESPANAYRTHESTLSSNTDQWHTYAVDWRAEYIAWIVDGEEVFRLNNDQWWSSGSSNASAPFDKPFYILLNLAVGGTYDPEGQVPSDFVSANMYVDYVRVYA